jgi:RES domain
MPARLGPDPLPDPPANLSDRALPIHAIEPALEGSWKRLYGCEHASALHFGGSRSQRFDDPEGQYGVLYAAIDVQCGFIESFGDSRNNAGELEIKEEDLGEECLATIAIGAALRLVDLTGPGLANIGADGRLSSGDDYTQTQTWSRALWSHPETPDGIYYLARHDLSRPSIAIFDRAREGIAESPHGSLTANRNRHHLLDILRTYRVSLI